MTLSLALVETSKLCDNVPEEFDGILEPSGYALCCSFNRQGSLLAVGCVDGSVVIYDFLTRTPAKTIFAHMQQVCSVSWSRSGRRLAVASLDNSVTVWDVMLSKCLLKWQFPSPLIKVQFNPRNDQVILVCPYKHPTVVLFVDSYDSKNSTHHLVPTDPDESDPNIVASFDRRGEFIYTGNSKGRVAVIKCPQLHEFFSQDSDKTNNNNSNVGNNNSVVTGNENSGSNLIDAINGNVETNKFSGSHENVEANRFSGSNGNVEINGNSEINGKSEINGNLEIPRGIDKHISVQNEEKNKMKVVATFKIQSSSTIPAAVREIEFGSRNKSFFLVNSSDRAIRMYNCQDVIDKGINGNCQEVRRFQELVNKTMWRRCCFSGNSEIIHVCGGSSRTHALYIWEADSGIIKKMLDGQKGELLLDVQWHPLRPVLVSVASGIVSLWAKAQIENWSAFAPDFKELEENIEYEERESEFDIDDEDNQKSSGNSVNTDETEDVDVLAMEADPDLISSDEDGDDPDALVFLPVVIDDVVAVVDDVHAGPPPPITKPTVTDPTPTAPLKLIQLENAPIDELHPLISGSSAKKYYNTSSQPVKRQPTGNRSSRPEKKKTNNHRRHSSSYC